MAGPMCVEIKSGYAHTCRYDECDNLPNTARADGDDSYRANPEFNCRCCQQQGCRAERRANDCVIHQNSPPKLILPHPAL